MMLVAVWCLGRPLFHFIGPFSCVIPGSHSTISVSVSLLAKWDLNYTIKLQKLKKPVNSGYIWNKVWDWASGIGWRLTLFCCFILCLFYLIFKIYLFFGYVLWHAGSQFSDQGLNLCPLQWQLGVLQWQSIGLSGKLLYFSDSTYKVCGIPQTVKNLTAMWETRVWSLGWRDPPGEGNSYPLQYSCLENSIEEPGGL